MPPLLLSNCHRKAQDKGIERSGPDEGGPSTPSAQLGSRLAPNQPKQSDGDKRGPVQAASAVATESQKLRRKIAEARMKGYEGDPCGSCGAFTLVRNGTCLKCVSCGGTSGCS